MKKTIIFLICIFPISVFADTIIFKSGREMKTSNAWEEGNYVKCYIADGIVSYPK